MKYLFTLLILSALACKKDNDQAPPKSDPPTVTALNVSSEIVLGVQRPKFTITLNVPDSAAVMSLHLYQDSKFPMAQSGLVVGPKSGQYVVIDSSATYPPTGAVKYFAYFTMKDYSYVSYYRFEVN